jgi:hypothetical protein
MGSVPQRFHWVFWDTDPETIDLAAHHDHVIPRVLEFGGLDEVRWLLAQYGRDAIHAFLRDVGSTELTPRTLGFWRVVLQAEDEEWVDRSGWRRASSEPWAG